MLLPSHCDQVVVVWITSRVEDLCRIIDDLGLRGEPTDQSQGVILADPLPELRTLEDFGELGHQLRAHHKLEGTTLEPNLKHAVGCTLGNRGRHEHVRVKDDAHRRASADLAATATNRLHLRRGQFNRFIFGQVVVCLDIATESFAEILVVVLPSGLARHPEGIADPIP